MKFINRFYPYIIFLILTIILFHEFIFSNEVLFSSDQLESGIFFRKMYADFVKAHGEIPMWDRFISGGLPFVDAMHGDTFYPAAVLKFFIPLHKALGLKLVLHVFLSGVFMFIFLKNYGLRKSSSLTGSVAYMLAPMIVSLVYPGHDAKMYVAALLPLGFHFLNKGLEGRGYRNFIYFGSVAGLMILSSHIQTTYFALWIFFFFTLYRVVTEYISSKNIKPASQKFAMFWAGIALMVLIGAVQLIPPYIYSKEFSIRGTEAKTSFEHAVSWGIHPEEAFSLIVPEFSGENRMSHVRTYDEQQELISSGGNSYWGRNPFKLNSEYSGSIILILSIMSVFLYRGRYRKDIIFFLSFGLFTLLYSLVDHTPLFRLVYTIVPGVKLFRGQGMILFILTFILSVVSAVFIDRVFDKREENDESFRKKMLYIFPSLFAAGLILTALFPVLMNIYSSLFDPPKMPSEDYTGFIRSGIMTVTLTVSVFTALVYFFLNKKITPAVFVLLAVLLLFFDAYRIDRKFIKTLKKSELDIKFTDTQLTKQLRELEQNEGYFRVLDLNVFGNNQLPIHGVSTVRGFHDNELKWYRKFRGVNKEGVNNDKNILDGINSEPNDLLDLAGTRFILYKNREGKMDIIQNEEYLPRAFVVSGPPLTVYGEDEIVEILKDSIDVSSTVVLEKEPVLDYEPDSNAGEVTEYRYEGNTVIMKASMKKNGIVVMTDNYFPYWHAYDENGNELEILKANLTFRAIELPPGEHTVLFKYRSIPYIIGKYMTISGLLILLGVILSKFFLRDRPQKQDKP